MKWSLRTSAVAISYLSLVGILVVGLGNALEPLLIAFVLAYLSFPMIRVLEKRGVRRELSVAAAIFTVFAALLAVVLLVVPVIVREAMSLIASLPATVTALLEKAEILAWTMGYEVEINKHTLTSYLAEQSSSWAKGFLKSTSVFTTKVFSSLLRGVLFVLNLALIPVFYIYLVNGYEVISRNLWDIVPIPWRPKLHRYASITNQVLSGYIRGQLMVALILSGLYGLAFVLVGLRFGLIIGMVTGFLNIIPYVGPMMGFSAAMLVGIASYSGTWSLLGPAIAFLVVQSLESLIITPKLVGDKVGLPVLPTMLALIIGGNLFGFIGMIIAVPVAGILRFALIELKEEYRSLPFYKGQ